MNLKKTVVLILSPIYIIVSLLKSMFSVIMPLASEIGDGISSIINDFYNSMYNFWEKIFKWR